MISPLLIIALRFADDALTNHTAIMEDLLTIVEVRNIVYNNESSASQFIIMDYAIHYNMATGSVKI